MKKIPRIALALMGAFVLSAAQNPDKPTVLVPPRPLKPGQTLILEVPMRLQNPPTLTWEDQSVPFYIGQNKMWRGLIRVPLTLSPGISTPTVHIPFGMSFKSVGVEASVEILPSGFGEETLAFSEDKAKLLNDPSEDEESRLIRDHLKEADDDPAQHWRNEFDKPVPGEVLSPYGIKRNKIGQDEPDFHRGVDLKADRGDPVKAPNHGRVLMAEHLKFHGNTVLLNHGQGVGSITIHLDSIEVDVGDKVKKGQIIGRIGSTGLATAPHLHWGVYVHGKAVDPVQWTEEKF